MFFGLFIENLVKRWIVMDDLISNKYVGVKDGMT